MNTPKNIDHRYVVVKIDSLELEGNLSIPEGVKGIVVFVHGSGSSRNSPRNIYVADEMQDEGLGTLLFDLLTGEEEQEDLITRRLRFDIDLLASRTISTLDWLHKQPYAAGKKIGLFGSSTGAAAALIAAAARPDIVQAVVSRGGRPDLAGRALPRVHAAALLIVGGNDREVISLNEQALDNMRQHPEKRLVIIPGASHLFEEQGALERVATLAGDFFRRYLSVDVDVMVDSESGEEIE